MRQRLSDFLRAHRVGTTPLLVAVSGGGDSVALLALLQELTREGQLLAPLLVAHHDHATGSRSAEDAAFVRDLASAHGLSLILTRGAGPGGPRPEATLRSERYDHLCRAAVEREGSLLTGHTLDDQAETVLAQLLRGAGPGGARGIAPCRSWTPPGGGIATILRPLLGTRRSELRRYLRDAGLPWREDPSNQDGSNLRGRLRTTGLPALEQLTGRDPAPALARFAATQAELVSFLDSSLPPAPDRETLARLPGALVTHWLRHQGVTSATHIAWARRLIRDTGRTGRRDLPGGRRLHVEGRHVWVEILREPPPPPPLPRLELLTGQQVPSPVPPGSCFLATSRIELPLSVRRRRPGDRFRPLGGPGSRLLSDFLSDLQVPRERRDQIPLVVTATGEIAWVAPYRVDARFAALPGEADALEIRLAWPLEPPPPLSAS